MINVQDFQMEVKSLHQVLQVLIRRRCAVGAYSQKVLIKKCSSPIKQILSTNENYHKSKSRNPSIF